MKYRHRCLLWVPVLAMALAATSAQENKIVPPDPARIAEIAAMLPEKPEGLGEPIGNREHWDKLAASPAFEFFVDQAANTLDQRIAILTEDFYREVAESGSRGKWYGFERPRYSLFKRWVLAECLEDKGRFLPNIEQALDAYFAEKTWFIPLYGARSLDNFEGRKNGIDLYKAQKSWEVALADYLLGDRLKPETRQRLRRELERRTFDSFRKSARGQHEQDWWFRTTNNWNAVCLAGPVGAALTLIESREDRAFFIATAENYIRNFLAGYPEDGYCTEGVSYWNFGFGHFIHLTEAVYQATGGRLDFLRMDPNIRDIALYGARIEIVNGQYPAFADCSPNSRPSEQIFYYVGRRHDLGIPKWNAIPLERRTGGRLYTVVQNAFPNSADAAQPTKTDCDAASMRSFFDTTGILTCRPGPASQARVGVALKGGHNGEHHNHNDVGTFVVVVDTEAPVADVGAVVYTKHTFGPRRYESDALNSFGHSVPLVGGKRQEAGRQAAARVVKTEFTDATDTLVLDLGACYDVPGLEKLQRTFTYSRQGEGSLTVADEMRASEPQAFEVALMTLGDAEVVAPDAVVVYGQRRAVRAEVAESSGKCEIEVEELQADLRGNAKAKRVGIALSAPSASARIVVRISPAPHPHVQEGRGILNGDFERQLAHWKIAEKETFTSLSTERSASGQYSLKIVDDTDTGGSSAWSDPMIMTAGKQYELRGKYYGVSGDEMGVVTRFYDANDRMLHLPDDAVRLSGTIKLGGSSEKWEPFAKRFAAPEGTHFARIWLHSFSAAKVEGYLDDLDIVEVDAADKPE